MKFRNLITNSHWLQGAALFVGMGFINPANAQLMFSYDQNLSNAQPVAANLIQARPVYFFDGSLNSQGKPSGRKVTIECCDWIGGPGSRNQGNVDSGSAKSGTSVLFDLSERPAGKVLSAMLIAGNDVAEAEFTVVRSSGHVKTSLVDSGPVVVSKDGQVIENLRINAEFNTKCAIEVRRFKNVVIRNVDITHKNVGICAYRSPNIRIEHVKAVSTSAPETGPHCKKGVGNCFNKKSNRATPDNRLNIALFESDNAHLEFIHVEKGSSGIRVYKSDDVSAFDIQCRDVRGPAPRGNCVQFGHSDNAYLKNFYAKNIKDVSYEYDVIAFFSSDNGTVSDGVVDGSFSRNGVGIISDRGSDHLTVTNVDFANTTNSALSISSNKQAAVYGGGLYAKNIRVKDTHCQARHNRAPSSGGLVLTVHPLSHHPEVINYRYWNHCRKHATYCLSKSCRSKRGGKGGSFDVREENFDMKKPLQLTFGWED